MASPRWGYTLDGRAHVFEDGVLPPSWLEVPPIELDAMEWTERAKAPLDVEAEFNDAPEATDNGEDTSGPSVGDSGEPRRGRGRPKRIG